METIGVFTKIFRYEETVKRAIESVLSQSFIDFRYYILVNENTRELAEQYAQEDSRVTVLIAKSSTENFTTYVEHISSNHSYLFLLDGDDFLELDCLEKLYQHAICEDLDITFCGNTFETDGKIKNIRGIKSPLVLSKHETLLHLPQMYQFLRTMWGKLWKASLFSQNDELPDSSHLGGYGGDTLKCFYLLNFAQRFGGIENYSYHYTINTASISHQLKEGRQKSDAFLFSYVYNILRSNEGTLTEQNLVFLFRVYQAAVIDTLNLLNTVKISFKEKCDLLLEVTDSPVTQRLFNLEKTCGNLNNDKSSLQKFCEIIFLPFFHLELDKNDALNYYPILISLFPKYKAIVTEDLFLFITKQTKLLTYLITEKENLLCLNMIYQLNDKYKSLTQDIIGFISSLSNNQLLNLAVEDLDFTIAHTELVISLFCKQYLDAALYCQKRLLDSDNDCHKIKLIEILLNASALSENVELFVFGKLYKMEHLYSMGDFDSSRTELNDLKDMGISNEIIAEYETLLY